MKETMEEVRTRRYSNITTERSNSPIENFDNFREMSELEIRLTMEADKICFFHVTSRVEQRDIIEFANKN